MSGSRGRSRWGALAMAGAAIVAAPAFGFAVGSLAALGQLERGRWQIVDSEGGIRHSLCLGDPMQLVQLEHRGGACSRELVSSATGGGTVQYSCPGRGFGHTTVHVETPRLARIDTQGLLNGRPFAYRAEARRVGAC